MLEDGINALETDTPPQVKDMMEILAASMKRKAV
jgi:hypothetical protein